MDALLEFKNVSKAFGANKANDKVSFTVKAGSIHALVGENGAGKSTIMKILFGLYQKDSGEIRIRGNPADFTSPIEAKRNGIGMVHQHFMLAGPLTGLDHIFLDEPANTNFRSFFKSLPKKRELQKLQALSDKYQMPVNWDLPVEELSVGFQQRLEILKLLHNETDILILDEPTAVLTPQETQSLFAQLRELRKNGKTILLITHKLKEVFRLADSVTVFRQGQTVGTYSVAETSIQKISELMVGRKLQELPQIPHPQQSKPLLEINFKNISFKVHEKEIVGIAGIEGNGQSQLIQILLNPKNQKSLDGDLLFSGASIANASALDLKKLGFSYFPEDRLHQGALLDSNLKENFALGLHWSLQFQKHGWIKWREIEKATEAQMRNFDVRPLDPKLKFSSLSGGNQQKLVVARELYRHPRFLLAAQPTRGVDIGAIERIHSEILIAKDRGCGVLLISSDLDELMKLSDRILVMFQGKIVGELPREKFDEMTIGYLMTGAVS